MPTKTYPNKELNTERREYIENTVTRAKKDYRDKTLPKWERTAIRAQHVSNSEVGKVIARSNPNETKNYHTKLQKLEWDRRNREQELFWKQRQFFIKRIFDENSQIRFNKARQKTFVEEPSQPQKDKRPEMFNKAKTEADFMPGKHNPGEAKMFIEMTNDRSAIPRSPLIKKRSSNASEPADPSKSTTQLATYYPRTRSLSVSDSGVSQVAVSYNIGIGSVPEMTRDQSLPNAFSNILRRDDPSSTTRWEGKLSDISENDSARLTMEVESDLDRGGRRKGSNEDGNLSDSLNHSTSSTRIKGIKWSDNQSGGSPNDPNDPTSSGIPMCSNGLPVVPNGSFPVPYVRKTQSAVFERNNLDRKYSFVSSSSVQGGIMINQSSAKLPQINTGIRNQLLSTNSKADGNPESKGRASWTHALVMLKRKQSRSSMFESEDETLPDFATVVQRVLRSVGRAQNKGELPESAGRDSPLSSNEVPTVDTDSREAATGQTLQMPSAYKTRKTPTPTPHSKTKNPETQDTDNIVKKIAVTLPSYLLATATNHGQELADKHFSARKERLLGVEQRSTGRRASDDPRFQRLMGSLSPRPADG